MNGSHTELTAERLANLLAAAALLVEAAPARLTPAERAALAAIASRGPLPLGAVAAAARIAKSSASELVGRLEARRLVRRERDRADARRLAIHITPRGRSELRAGPPPDSSRLAGALASLPPGSLAQLEELLGALTAAGAALPGVPAQAGAPAAAAAGAAAAATSAARPVSSELRLLVLVAGGAEYALPLDRVREVIPYTRPRRLASPSPWLAGVISVRGALVPVCDLRRRLGVAAKSQAESYVLVDGPDGDAALAVDRVAGLVTAVAGEVSPPVGGGIGVSGIVTAGDRLLVLLEIDELLDDGRAA